MKTPFDKTIVFSYYSHPTEDVGLRWQMRLTFPAGATAVTPLLVEVVDSTGAPIEKGTMEMSGSRVEIVHGRGVLAYADFVRGKHERALWLHREGLEPVPGALTFA